MAVGDSWTGAYGYSSIVPGQWTVLPWSLCLVLIDGVNVTDLFYCENTNNINFGAGSCTIRASDPLRAQYLTFQEGDEIEIYMNDTHTANKVWGGYIENIRMSQQEGKLLEITGKDYSSRLQNQIFSDTFAGVELSDCVSTILSYQSDFTSSITPTASKPISAAFSYETLFNALQKACGTYDYYFWIDVDKVAHIMDRTAISFSPDTLTAGSNVSRRRAEQDNRQNLVNQVTVTGNGGITQTAQDLDSQAAYGIYSKDVTVASLTTAASVLAYAQKYIDTYKDPRPNQILETKFLPYTDPRETMTVNVPDLGMVGDYQVIRHTRKWGKGEGLKSEVELSNNITDVTLQLGNFERRIRDVENAVF